MEWKSILAVLLLGLFIILLYQIPRPSHQSSYPSLHSALSEDNAKLAVFLIHQGADVNEPNSDGMLPIQAAMNLHDDDDVYYVLKHLTLAGASLTDVPESRRISPAWQSIYQEYADYWQDIIESKGEIGRWDWLRTASVAAVQQLLEYQQFEISEIDSHGDQPLHKALEYQNVDVAEYLMNCDADVLSSNSKGQSVRDLIDQISQSNIPVDGLEHAFELARDRAGWRIQEKVRKFGQRKLLSVELEPNSASGADSICSGPMVTESRPCVPF